MNHCGTCKYFGAARLGTEDNPSITVADFASVMIAQPEGEGQSEEGALGPYKVCGLIEMKAYGELPAGANPVAYVEDGSNYYAALCVSEDFGCNQWAEK